MKNFEYFAPTKVIFGGYRKPGGALVIKRRTVKRFWYITAVRAPNVPALCIRIFSSLTDAGVDYVSLGSCKLPIPDYLKYTKESIFPKRKM